MLVHGLSHNRAAMLHRLRHATRLARFALAWFVLSLAAAVVAPLAMPGGMELVCSSTGGLKLLVKSEDGGGEQSRHTLDCPLCAHVASPPPAAVGAAEPPHPLAHVLRPAAAAHIAWLTAAPPPGRGPPALS